MLPSEHRLENQLGLAEAAILSRPWLRASRPEERLPKLRGRRFKQTRDRRDELFGLEGLAEEATVRGFVESTQGIILHRP